MIGALEGLDMTPGDEEEAEQVRERGEEFRRSVDPY